MSCLNLKHWRLIALGILLLPVLVFGQQNAGFVQGLWYSSETIFADQPVRVYVAIRNNTGNDLTGTITFYDNGDRFERRPISALNGRVIESWADWKPSYGEHTITARLTDVKIDSITGEDTRINLETASAEDTLFVDYDTDEDGIGNATDPDDDNDGVTDETEAQNGTDPLVANSPPESDTATDRAANQDSEISQRPSTTEPTGLERYLTDGSRVDTVLTNFTNTINSTRNQLDAYRDSRQQLEVATSSESSPTTEVTARATSTESGSFGPVTRVQGDTPGWWNTFYTWLKNNLQNGYDLLLFILSSFLWRPVLVQLIFLFFLLWIFYMIAKKIGARRGR